MKLKKPSRSERKSTESVTDEKFALLFQSNIVVGHGEIVFPFLALSLPVVVIVHGNQKPQSWATITWDNAFAEINRVLFAVPDRVPWKRLAEVLKMKFKSSTGRALTQDNLNFLCQKIFKSSLPSPIPNDSLVSYSQFCKNDLPDCTFTFWEWYYAAMKLTRDFLHDPWMNNSIIGFIDKREAEEMLTNYPRGTFLLRFSDSMLGGITIAYCNEGNDGKSYCLHIRPFTSDDLSIRSLSDRICDFDDLQILYPNIPKIAAFGKEKISSTQPTKKGYIPSEIRAILTTSTTSMMNSIPNTQQSSYLQSPDPSRDTASLASG
jgi:signal transducer and activator of transcription 5B